MEGALISVIVPAYNVEAYLAQCLDSLLAQTYRNLEIIVVDDGSTDGTGALADDYAVADDRVRVIHQRNGGLSAARNAALNVMTGSLVMMVDSDDYVAPNCVATLLHTLESTESDIAMGQWHTFSGQPPVAVTAGKGRITTFTGEEAIDDVFYQRTLTNSAWGRLIRASLLGNVRFPEGMLYEDMAIIYRLLQPAQRVAHTTAVIYYYRQRPDSILGHFTPKRAHVLDILTSLESQVAAEAPQHLSAVRSRLLSACFNMVKLAPRHLEGYDALMDRCWQGIVRLRDGCFRDPNVRLKNKVAIIASHMGKKAFMALFGSKK